MKKKVFEKFAVFVSRIVGSPTWFFFSVVLILIWFPSGFFIGFTAIWHLLINTFTTILTFLMMSLLHASQSKWERKMERIEARQERVLKMLEEKTEKVVERIDNQQNSPQSSQKRS